MNKGILSTNNLFSFFFLFGATRIHKKNGKKNYLFTNKNEGFNNLRCLKGE